MGAGASVTDVGPISPPSPVSAVSSSITLIPGDLAAVRTFVVSLHAWGKNAVQLPARFTLRISLESLDFVEIETGRPLVQFPFQNILCWGSSSKVFQFSVFDVENCLNGKGSETIPIYLRTTEGRLIEKWIMENVRRLMADMAKPHAVTKAEFRGLKNLLFQITTEQEEVAGSRAAEAPQSFSQNAEPAQEDAPDNSVPVLPADASLREDWLQVIDQFSCNGRKFLTKQGMELMLLIGPLMPFEKFDLALLLYDRIINSESYQLIINTFEDEAERENLILRLRDEKKSKEARSGKFTPSCKIMTEYVPTPGSPSPVKHAAPSRVEVAGGSGGEGAGSAQYATPRPSGGSNLPATPRASAGDEESKEP